MKCQNLVSWENERNISKCRLILHRVLSVQVPHFLTDKDIFSFHSDIQCVIKNHFLRFIVHKFHYVKRSNSNL